MTQMRPGRMEGRRDISRDRGDLDLAQIQRLFTTSGLRRGLIPAGPKSEIAAPYSNPDLICRKS